MIIIFLVSERHMELHVTIPDSYRDILLGVLENMIVSCVYFLYFAPTSHKIPEQHRQPNSNLILGLLASSITIFFVSISNEDNSGSFDYMGYPHRTYYSNRLIVENRVNVNDLCL